MIANTLKLFSGAVVGSGNTKSTPQKVSHRTRGRAFLDVTAFSGSSLDVDVITYDKLSEKWHVIKSFTTKTGTGTEVVQVEDVGEKIAIQYVLASSATFSVNVILT